MPTRRSRLAPFITERDKQPLISVTKEIIKESVSRDSSHCVIAEAIKSKIPKAKRVSVDLQTIRFSIGTRRYIYLTPRSAQRLLVDFDQGLRIRAMQFRLQNAQILEATPIDGKKRAALVVHAGSAANRAKAGRKPIVHKTGGKAPPRLPAQRRTYGVKALVK